MKNKKQIERSVLLVILILIASFHAAHQTGSAEENEVITERDIVYGKGDSVDLMLDLARPAKGRAPFPALIFLFGGGFTMGNRTQFCVEIRKAAERGYVAVTIDYRLTSVRESGKVKYPFPSQVHDAKCAVRWLRVNANKYKIYPNRIGVVGWSAGGHLALMLGLTSPSDGLEGSCGKKNYSSRVQAVVNLAGPTDLTVCYRSNCSMIEALLGGSPQEVPNRYEAASPLTYVSSDAPPVLSICGTNDGHLSQAKLLDDRMKAAGAFHSLIVVDGAGHFASQLVNFHEDNPVWDFFDEHLKAK